MTDPSSPDPLELLEYKNPHKFKLATLRDAATQAEDFYLAQAKLDKLPKNSSPVRLVKRCSLTGRPRATIRKFGLSRITFRELALQGKIPGVIKASW